MEYVQVLLSTYQGTRFLRLLLESVLAQDYIHVGILARDDASTDGSLELLQTYANGQITVIAGDRLGAAGSFMALLRESAPDATYIAFCDQDDVWLPDKLSRAVAAIRSVGNRPALYCTRLVLVDERLEILGYSTLPRRLPSFYNGLVENIAIGATIVMNTAARSLLLQCQPTTAMLLMHDAWAYLVIVAFGEVIYDPVPSVLYRQHAANTIGAQSGKWLTRVKRLSRLKRRYTLQAEEFRRCYGDMLQTAQRAGLDRFLDERKTAWGRITYAIRPDVYRQSLKDELIMRLLIATNYL